MWLLIRPTQFDCNVSRDTRRFALTYQEAGVGSD